MINSGFTATINVELSVGSLNETITVAGESPIVDVRTTTGQYVVTSEVVNTLPSSRNVFDMGKFMVGFSTGVPEVGGSRSQNYGDGWQIHGSRGTDRSYYRDGLPASSYFGGGDAPMSYGGTGANEEVNYQTTAIPASVQIGGVAMILVTKSGGNQFSGTVFASGANEAMQSSNLDDELRARGVRATSGGTKAYDIDTGIGGPILKDRIWFFWQRPGVVVHGAAGQPVRPERRTDGVVRQAHRLLRQGDLAGQPQQQGHLRRQPRGHLPAVSP